MEKDISYQSINRRINQSVRYYRVPSTVEKDAALNSLLNAIKEETPQQKKIISLPAWTRTAAAVAAVLIVVFVSGMLISSQNIKNEGNKVFTFRLPDQSRVVLTSESSVKFNKWYWNRNVKLKGKAYFEVEKGSTFRVKTSKGNVEVLGTRFMVDEKNERLQVICFEGKVKASFGDKEVILVPGSGISLSSDQKQENMRENEEYPAFAMFSADYHNVELNRVVKDMESFFGVQIENHVRQQRYFSGTLNTGNLETALSILTVSLQLEFKIESDRTIVINNQKIQKNGKEN
jgi:transmembrane sensor